MRICSHIFGSKAAYSIRTIKDAVAAGRCMPPATGRPPSFPRAIESVLWRFFSKLRQLTYPLVVTMMCDYAKRLLEGTVASLNFAKVRDGEYIADPDGGVQWDEVKLRNWVYRRMVGDRRPEGATTGNQKLLDLSRAKWLRYSTMKAYYETDLRALVDNGIVEMNKLYDETDKD